MRSSKLVLIILFLLPTDGDKRMLEQNDHLFDEIAELKKQLESKSHEVVRAKEDKRLLAEEVVSLYFCFHWNFSLLFVFKVQLIVSILAKQARFLVVFLADI